MIKFLKHTLIPFVLFMAMSSYAHAVSILGTDTFNTTDDLTLLDNGLEFLDLTTTGGLSIATATSTYSGDGFRFATYTEIRSLLSAFGISTPDFVPIDYYDLGATSAQVSSFNSYLGITGSNASIGWFDDEGATSATSNYACIGLGCSPISFINDWTTTQHSGAGTFLVRDTVIPAPAPLVLMALGLVGLVFSRRKT